MFSKCSFNFFEQCSSTCKATYSTCVSTWSWMGVTPAASHPLQASTVAIYHNRERVLSPFERSNQVWPILIHTLHHVFVVVWHLYSWEAAIVTLLVIIKEDEGQDETLFSIPSRCFFLNICWDLKFIPNFVSSPFWKSQIRCVFKKRFFCRYNLIPNNWTITK